MLQNNTFLDSIFEWIFFVLASENEGKMSNFRILNENAHFAKIIVFRRRKIAIFLVRSFQKSIAVRCSNALKNNVTQKSLENRIWGSICASKILEDRFQKRCKTNPVARRYGTHAQVVAS